MNNKNKNIAFDTERADTTPYREYDGLVGLTLLNIYSLSCTTGKIKLAEFDRKNKEHMFILHVAMLARDLYQFPIEIDCNWWNRFCLNRYLHKGYSKVGKIRDYAGYIFVPGMLDFMRKDGTMACGENFSFADIYEAYYKRSK